MKIWVKVTPKEGIEFSRHWDTNEALSFGAGTAILDYEDGVLSLISTEDSTVQIIKLEKDAGQATLADGTSLSFHVIPTFEAVSAAKIREQSHKNYELPESDHVDLEEAFYSKTLKLTSFGGVATLALALVLTSVFNSKNVEESELAEVKKEAKARVVKLRNAPKPDVIAAAYQKAMMKGAAQKKNVAKKKPASTKKKKSSVASIKSAFSSLMSGGLSLPKAGAAKKAAPNRPVAVLRGVQSDGSALGRGRGGAGRKKGDSVIQVAMVGAGDGSNYNVAGDAAGVGMGGLDGQGEGWVNLNINDAVIEEGLSRDEVGRVIHQKISEVRYCYEASMIRHPELEGKLVVDFTISSSGRVRTAQVSNTSISDARLNECILKRLTRWDFPKPKAGVEVAVSYPFIFKRLRR